MAPSSGRRMTGSAADFRRWFAADVEADQTTGSHYFSRNASTTSANAGDGCRRLG